MSADIGYQTLEFTGLGTLSYTVGTTGFYSVQSKSSIPTITSGGVPSSLVTTIQKNGSTVTNGASVAGASGMSVSGISCAVGDVLSVVYSSALASDAAPTINVIKSQVVIFLGA
jgi:hypothetical protein